jgi:hypothetical protein
VFGLVNNRSGDLSPAVLASRPIVVVVRRRKRVLFFNLVWRADLSEVPALLTTFKPTSVGTNIGASAVRPVSILLRLQVSLEGWFELPPPTSYVAILSSAPE